MAGKEIRIDNRRFEAYDFEERLAPESRTHPSGRPTLGTFTLTLPRTVGIGAVVEMERGDSTTAIVADVTPWAPGEFKVRGWILGPLPAP